MLEHLNKVNDVKIHSVFAEEFRMFGRVIEEYDFSDLCRYMKEQTPVPESGNIYIASDEGLERFPLKERIENELYGGMPVQIGYCNGRNSTYNGFEYHKGSEINVAVSDFCLVLGHTWQIKDNKFYVGDETVFYVPEGTVIEMYQTTLHLSPCRVCEAGFRDIVILPKGTNTPLTEKPKNASGEAALLLQKNKWVLAHPEREPLIKQGAVPGLIGENKEIKF